MLVTEFKFGSYKLKISWLVEAKSNSNDNGISIKDGRVPDEKIDFSLYKEMSTRYYF